VPKSAKLFLMNLGHFCLSKSCHSILDVLKIKTINYSKKILFLKEKERERGGGDV
jgi:hypothetical protein